MLIYNGTDTGMLPKDILTLIISGFAFIVSAATFLWARIQERSASKSALVKALQGEKEAVAFVAYQIETGAWNSKLKEAKFRKDIIIALSLAFTMEGSDRAKALAFAALKKLTANHKPEIEPVLKDICKSMKEYQNSLKPSNFDHRVKSIETLMKELQIPIC